MQFGTIEIQKVLVTAVIQHQHIRSEFFNLIKWKILYIIVYICSYELHNEIKQLLFKYELVQNIKYNTTFKLCTF